MRGNAMRGALQHLVDWAAAYPLDIFPKPVLGSASMLLAKGGMTFGSISADVTRYVLEVAGKVASFSKITTTAISMTWLQTTCGNPVNSRLEALCAAISCGVNPHSPDNVLSFGVTCAIQV